MRPGQFTLKYLLLEVLVTAMALGAWRLTLDVPFRYRALAWLAILLTAPPAIAGLFGPRSMWAGFRFTLVICLGLAITFGAAILLTS
jgi:hypothetical protein